MGRNRLGFLPTVITGDEILQIVVEHSQPRKQIEVGHDKYGVGEELVDKGKNIKGEINGQLPSILHSEAFLIAKNFITDGIAGHIGFIKRPH